ncbi:LytTR family DNA-binding domain-containing protein [Anaerococcus jeddahensis]|uniref:LytTR family DNA-binding domain-containing protein n=1 Tax=Anaerococcus jeddahensis TaxID=1673719 RepID=UPI000672479B|nr:LytTR family DNA-binding domain-containing protein [Anaerococcus jeddahensis]MDU2829318.1 LytTR family DNA-binding domain-containing protein [Anaerococcus sp.]
MKVEIIIDENLDESLVKIYAPSYNKDIENIKRSLEATNINKLVVFKDDEIYLLEYEEIIRCISKNKGVFIESKNGEYKSRMRLYELYERFDNKFIKISRYEIINIDYVKKLDLSFKGTIAVEFKNGSISYVSRRYLKEFKKALGF